MKRTDESNPVSTDFSADDYNLFNSEYHVDKAAENASEFAIYRLHMGDKTHVERCLWHFPQQFAVEILDGFGSIYEIFQTEEGRKAHKIFYTWHSNKVQRHWPQYLKLKHKLASAYKTIIKGDGDEIGGNGND